MMVVWWWLVVYAGNHPSGDCQLKYSQPFTEDFRKNATRWEGGEGGQNMVTSEGTRAAGRRIVCKQGVVELWSTIDCNCIVL